MNSYEMLLRYIHTVTEYRALYALYNPVSDAHSMLPIWQTKSNWLGNYMKLFNNV